MINSPQAWSAKANAKGQWMQMDLNQAWLVGGTVIQPRVGNTQYVTKYKVKTSLDGKNWNDVGATFEGHGSETWENMFDGQLINARYVRIYPQSWSGHMSLRADVMIAAGTAVKAPSVIIRAGVPERSRKYSSIWDNNAIATGHARSMINSPQAWSAKTNAAGQWVQMDLGSLWYVAGTVIQPRVGNTQYVTQYTVKVSKDNKKWTDVAGTYSGTSNSVVENLFTSGDLLQARYVRMVVKKWGGHVSLRCDVLIAAASG